MLNSKERENVKVLLSTTKNEKLSDCGGQTMNGNCFSFIGFVVEKEKRKKDWENQQRQIQSGFAGWRVSRGGAGGGIKSDPVGKFPKN